MATIQCFVLFALLVSVQGSTVGSEDISDLFARMASLEEKISKQGELEDRITVLEAKMVEKDRQITQLIQQCNDASQSRQPFPERDPDVDAAVLYMNDTNETDGIEAMSLDGVRNNSEGHTATLPSDEGKKVEEVAAHTPLPETRSPNVKTDMSIQPVNRIQKRLLNVEGPVSFTATLQITGSHQDHVGIGQTIKYNQVLTNIGNAYNMHSGIFTAPTEGLYLFSFAFAIGWDAEHAGLRLMVDSVSQVGGVATSTQFGMDIQGGNLATLHLQAGQAAWIESFMINDIRLFAANGFSTFSGILLYQF